MVIINYMELLLRAMRKKTWVLSNELFLKKSLMESIILMNMEQM
jgi:hypothetical protein